MAPNSKKIMFSNLAYRPIVYKTGSAATEKYNIRSFQPHEQYSSIE